MTENKKATRKFEPGDTAWVMADNRPAERFVFAVVESLSTFPWGADNEFHYHLAAQRIGTGWGNNEGIKYSEDRLFATKEELIETL